MDAILYEIVICVGTGANDNVKRIEGYLAHRYARTLPATHKYESFAPASGLHGIHNQDLLGELALDVSGPLVSDTLAGAV